MSFIPDAKNFEAAMLQHALKHVEKGFYIDAGAHRPATDSVTKAFYEQGWHGINIELTSECFQLLQQERPRDINLHMAVSNHQGEIVFYEIEGAALSILSETCAARYAETGYNIRTNTIPCTTLDTICAEHNIKEVHFLEINVAGAEKSVLEGFSLTQVRPWIIIVESSELCLQVDDAQDWASLLTRKGYEPAHFDGLSSYYIARERPDLRIHFSTPPNCFDDYFVYQKRQAQQEVAGEQSGRQALAAQSQDIYASISSRLTAPLRKSRQLPGSFIPPLKQKARSAILGLMGIALRYDWLRRFAPLILNRQPNIKDKLLKIAQLANPSSTIIVPLVAEQLPESARSVYAALHRMYDQNSTESPEKCQRNHKQGVRP